MLRRGYSIRRFRGIDVGDDPLTSADFDELAGFRCTSHTYPFDRFGGLRHQLAFFDPLWDRTCERIDLPMASPSFTGTALPMSRPTVFRKIGCPRFTNL